MSEARSEMTHDVVTDEEQLPPVEPLGLTPDPVEVRRNGGLAALVGAVASSVAIAYLARATGTGSWLDWSLAAVMGLLAVGHLVAFVDARTPLLVADGQGVRIRLGRSWRGMPWGALARVEHLPRRGLLRDGRLVLVAHNPERALAELDARGRRQTRLAERLYGAPLAVPLALSTRVTGAGEDLGEALVRLAGPASPVVVLSRDEVTGTQPEPGLRRWPDPRPALGLAIAALARLQRPHRAEEVEEGEGTDEAAWTDETQAVPLQASATPSPLREPVTAVRAELRHEPADPAVDLDHEGRELRRPGSVNLVEDTMVWSDRVRPIARAGAPVEPLVLGDFEVEPAADPVIGPELVAARTRLGLTVDQLAERTRIRPHVIESIEVDDFSPCGGDFYARGHLRTLARILGVDCPPLLTAYDERYADAPINPRRVFEAELATGAHGSIRGTRGGPNWSVLIAAVMALVLAWSIARLVMDSPVELRQQAPILNGSGSPDNTFEPIGDPVPVMLRASGGGVHVVVLDGAGNEVFSGDLAFGESRTLKDVAPPVRVQSSDGALEVFVDGEDRGSVGEDGQPAQGSYPVR